MRMRRLGRTPWLGVLAVSASLAIAPALGRGDADAPHASHGARAPVGPAAEQRLRALEERTLGPAHAAEHAAMRERARSAPSPDEAPSRTVAAAAVSTDPADVGRWTPKFSIPGVAVHAVMLRTGKVLYFTGTTSGRAFLLDPVTRTTRAVYPPRVPGLEDEPANIFCAGQSFLDDGTVLVMGGTVGRREGMDTILIFDPISETWKLQGRMRHGRWYPTQVLLADGRTVVMDGLDEQGEPHVNPQIESYDANVNFTTLLSVRGQADHPPSGGLYPHLFQMPSGRVLVAGPEPADSWFFRLSAVGALSWEDAPNPVRHTFGTGVLLPGTPSGSTRVALIGGVDRDALSDSGSSTPLPTVETFDEADPGAGWSPAPPLNYGRAHQNTVLLPDGSMVTVGGGYGILNGNRRAGDPAIHRNIEIWDRETGEWRLGPAQDELRTYHSTALLLPDGRVMSAGDDGYGGSSNDTAEIYEPPYLFRGARPTIDSAPDSIAYGETFTVDASADATGAVLMAPAAVTHANDMSQRNVPLAATAGAPGSLTVTAPAAPSLAPPSYYMLFVLNDAGVPSTARFVRLKFAPGSGPPDTTITSGPAATTQSTIASFEFQSSRPGSTFRCRLDGGSDEPCSSPWSYEGLAAGSHSFDVTASGPAGNADPTPATRSWTVDLSAPDVTPPETTITYGPVSTTATTAMFEFTSNEPGSSFTCRLDGAAWQGCTSPASYGGLSVGAHTLYVRATDQAGNTDPSPATWAWSVLSAASFGPQGPAPGATALADSTAPVLRVRSRRRQGPGRIVVEASCTNESCAATASGRGQVSGAARAFKLRPASARIPKGSRARLVLRFSKSAARRVRRALRRRQRVRVTVVLTATDAAGNTATSRRRITLKG